MNVTASVKKAFCTGCSACSAVCPVDAICMVRDNEGFEYPQIDMEKCTDCSLCYKTCPSVINTERNTNQPECFAAWGDDKIREKSSSGGIFSLLAGEVLQKPNGVVIGAAYSDDFCNIQHIMIEQVSELEKLQGSKYAQSSMGTILRQVRDKLRSGAEVLFSGCPCQVAAVYSFLGRDHDNLTTVDLVCHGVPSPGVYQSYVKELEKRRKNCIVAINMRDKSVAGWGQHTGVYFEDGGNEILSAQNCMWKKTFLDHFSLRPSCHNCKYCSTNRHGDITLGDFWGISQFDTALNDGKGTSLVLINSKKGERLWRKIASSTFKKPVPLEFAKSHNANMNNNPPHRNPGREHFFIEWRKTQSFGEATAKVLNKQYDVGILGWWYYENYGAALTAYGLKRAVEKLGYSAVLVDEPESKHGSARTRGYMKVRKFANRYSESIQVKNEAELVKLNDYCDIFISGSDQMWNPDLKNISGWEYYLDFVPEEKKKISYASSFGDNERYCAPLSDRVKTQYLLERFDYVSVRENMGKVILKDTFGIDAAQVVDPVFLCEKEEYAALKPVNFSQPNKPYLLAYLGLGSSQARQIIEDAAQRLGLKPVVIFDAAPERHEKNRLALGMDDSIVANADVTDFIHYIRNAEFIITDTFHGTCFAIIFEKPFIALLSRAAHQRQISLLQTLHLETRVLTSKETVGENLHLLENIDYSVVNECLKQLIQESKEWLEHALSAKKTSKDYRSCYDLLRMDYQLLMEKTKVLERNVAELRKRVDATAGIVETHRQKPVADKRKSLLCGLFACLEEHGVRYTFRRVLVKLRFCKD